MRFRDSKGRFSKLDRRKYLYDTKGELVHVPTIGFITEDLFEVPKFIYRTLPAKIDYAGISFYNDRKPEEDLYAYFTRKKVNQHIASLKRKYPRSTFIASVDISYSGRKVTTQKFPIEGTFERFIGGKRKGRKYTPKDSIAYFIHDHLNEMQTSLYRMRTDTKEMITGSGRKKKYAKGATFRIKYQAIPRYTTTIKSKNKRR